MKKLLFVIVFAGLAIGMFYSCKKDVNQEPVSGNLPDNISSVMSQEDVLMQNNILGFRNNIGKHLKSDESVSVDSALWYMESTINYTYCGHDFEYTPISADSLIYDLPISNDGSVLLEDIDNLYNEIISDLTIIYNNIDADVKHMIYTTIVINNSNRDGSSVTVQVNSGFGINPLFTYGSFDEDDDWMYGDGLGLCNDPNSGSDAAEEIEYKLNNPENPPTLPAGYYYYYTNPNTYLDLYPTDWPNPNDDVIDNMYDYLVFYNVDNGFTPNYHLCLSDDEMNFYLAGTANVLNSYYPDGLRPSGYTFVSIDMFGTMIVPSQNPTIVLHTSWDNQLVYGIQHIGYNPPSDL